MASNTLGCLLSIMTGAPLDIFLNEKGPSTKEEWFLVGELFLKIKQEVIAICAYEQAIELGFEKAKKSCAYCMMMNNKPEEALKLLDEILMLDKNDADAWIIKAKCYKKINDVENEKDALQSALNAIENQIIVSPSECRLFITKATILSSQGNIEEATSTINLALNFDKQNQEIQNEAKILKANLLAIQGKFDIALTSVEEILFKEPEMQKALDLKNLLVEDIKSQKGKNED